MKRDYIGYLLAVVGILISSYAAWYFYDKSLQTRRPVFIADFLPQIVYDATEKIKLPLQVMRADGTPLEASVFSANHVFWNAGNLPITQQDLLTPIRIKMTTEDIDLLGVSVRQVSREVVRCEVVQDGKDAFILSFRILEQEDGCFVNVVYSGQKSIKYEVDANIVGVRELQVSSETVWDLMEKDRSASDVPRKIFQALKQLLPWIAALTFYFVIGFFCVTSTRTRNFASILLIVAVGAWALTLFLDRNRNYYEPAPMPATSNWASVNSER